MKRRPKPVSFKESAGNTQRSSRLLALMVRTRLLCYLYDNFNHFGWTPRPFRKDARSPNRLRNPSPSIRSLLVRSLSFWRNIAVTPSICLKLKYLMVRFFMKLLNVWKLIFILVLRDNILSFQKPKKFFLIKLGVLRIIFPWKWILAFLNNVMIKFKIFILSLSQQVL